MSTNDSGLPEQPPAPEQPSAIPTTPATDATVDVVQRRWITEDWAATATGLALLLLLLTGILPKGWLL